MVCTGPIRAYMGVSKNRGTPKSSMFNRVFHYFHPPFWGFPPILGNTPYTYLNRYESIFLDLLFYLMPKSTSIRDPSKASPETNKLTAPLETEAFKVPHKRKWIVFQLPYHPFSGANLLLVFSGRVWRPKTCNTSPRVFPSFPHTTRLPPSATKTQAFARWQQRGRMYQRATERVSQIETKTLFVP